MRLSATRRSVLQQAGAVAAFATTCGAIENIARANTTSGEGYWELVRRQFIFPETAVPMNCANLCPSFQSVAEKVVSLSRLVDHDVSFNNRAQFNEALRTSWAKVAAQIGAAPEEVALVRNTTEGSSFITNGLNDGAGDEIVIRVLQWRRDSQTLHWCADATSRGASRGAPSRTTRRLTEGERAPSGGRTPR